jgi:hypothetical protein
LFGDGVSNTAFDNQEKLRWRALFPGLPAFAGRLAAFVSREGVALNRPRQAGFLHHLTLFCNQV